MKLKFNFKGGEPGCQPFIDLLQGRKDEIILRQTDQLEYISDAADAALQMPGSDHEKLESLKKILSKKVVFTGTKAQIKPSFSAEGECEKIHIVVKWGGEYTHAARYQSRDIGENMRKDLTIMNQWVAYFTFSITLTSLTETFCPTCDFTVALSKASRKSTVRPSDF